MFKLVILIEPPSDMLKFEERWPEFLDQAEKMPGLKKETFSPVYAKIHGGNQVAMIHELYFESPDALREAMASEAGLAAGAVLQEITDGHVTLLFADHLEDEIANIQALKLPQKDDLPGDKA